MNKSSYHILRVGIAITFLWIGILIFKEPEDWGAYIPAWLSDLLPFSLKIVMISTAILDILIGFFLLIDYLMQTVTLIASFHLLAILIISGINAITVRDIGLLAAVLSLFLEVAPPNYRLNKKNYDRRIRKWITAKRATVKQQRALSA